MSVLTRVRTVEEQVLRTQLPEQAPARPQSSWPLPATRLPGARLTWAEWVDLQASQLAREPYGEHPSHLEASATPR
jgi:phage terminase large subunit-like protein